MVLERSLATLAIITDQAKAGLTAESPLLSPEAPDCQMWAGTSAGPVRGERRLNRLDQPAGGVGAQLDRDPGAGARRLIDAVGIFPSRQSLLRLTGALLEEQSDEWAVGRRYFSAESMTKLYEPSQEEVVQALLELQPA